MVTSKIIIIIIIIIHYVMFVTFLVTFCYHLLPFDLILQKPYIYQMDLPPDASKDQSNVPNGYYRKNTGMVNMLPAGNGATFTPVKLTDEELARLEQMSKGELIALIKRVSGAMWGIGLSAPKETAQAMLDNLAAMVLCSGREKTSLRDVINAATTWLDRVEGRPKQTVEANINLSYALLLDQVSEKRDKMITIDSRTIPLI